MSTPRVLMLAYYFPPVAGAGVFRTLRFVRYLPEFGWDPVVVSVRAEASGERRDDSLVEHIPSSTMIERTGMAFPEKYAHSIFDPIRAKLRRTKSPNDHGITGSAQHSHQPSDLNANSLGSIARNAFDFLFMTPDDYVCWIVPAVQSAMRAILRSRPCVLYTTGPPHSTHLAGLLLKWRTRLAWIADFRDPWSRRPWGKKARNPWGQHSLKHFERLCVQNADSVILNTPNMAEDFRRHYSELPAHKFCVIPNGFDPAIARDMACLLQGTRPATSNGSLRLCHAGSLYRRRDPKPIFDAIKLLSDAHELVTFEQIGACDDSFDLPSYIEKLNLGDRVRLEGPTSHSNALARMAEADILVVIQPENQIQVPGKLFEMFMFQKPILALTDRGATAEIIEQHGLGAVVNSTNPSEIANAIRQAATLRFDPQFRVRSASVLRQYDGRSLTGTLANLLSDITSRRTSRTLCGC